MTQPAIDPGEPPYLTQPHALRITRSLYFLYYAAFGVFVTYLDIYIRALGCSGTRIGWIPIRSWRWWRSLPG